HIRDAVFCPIADLDPQLPLARRPQEDHAVVRAGADLPPLRQADGHVLDRDTVQRREHHQRDLRAAVRRVRRGPLIRQELLPQTASRRPRLWESFPCASSKARTLAGSVRSWALSLIWVASARAWVTVLRVRSSCWAEPFTVATKLGTRSARRWYTFSTWPQAA